MCPAKGGPTSSSAPRVPIPDAETLALPPAYILAHLTDAHCHPTDIKLPDEDYANTPLGGLAAMAVSDDQGEVDQVACVRPWSTDPNGTPPKRGPRVVGCFGYHPWYVHRFCNGPPPPKEEHYRNVFNPKPAQEEAFAEALRLLPDPEDFNPRLERLRADVKAAQESKRLVMVGEVGLDASARVRLNKPDGGAYLSPFKTVMSHQLELARAQLQVAEETGVPVSWHCVSASGPTLELFRDSFPRVHVDVHSLGGMAPEFLRTMAKSCPNAYFSPSLLITARMATGPDGLRLLPRDRILVESDTHELSKCTRLVWGAVLWIAACRGWRIEGGATWPNGAGDNGQTSSTFNGTNNTSRDDEPQRDTCSQQSPDDWEIEEEDEFFDDRGRVRDPLPSEIWTVRTLERNFARFMGIVNY